MHKRVAIGNNQLEIAVSATTGKLVSLLNKQTGDDYLKIRGIKNAIPFQLIGCRSDKKMIKLIPKGEPRIVEGGAPKRKEITVSYDRLSNDKRDYRLTVSYTVALDSDSEESIWTLRLANRERGFTVNEVLFPCLYGVMLGPGHEDNMLLYPYNAGQRIVNPVEALPCKETFTFWPAVKKGSSWVREIRHSGRCSMPWLDLCTAEEGLYLASYDENFVLMGIRAETGGPARPWMGLAMNKFVSVPFGKTWESRDFGVGVHCGDWHWGAKRYARWARERLAKPAIPRWFRENPSMITHYDFNANRARHHRFEDIPRLFDEAKTVGIDHLKMASYNRGGFDTFYPEFFPDMRLGTPCDLAEGISYVRRKGGHLMFYINAKIFNQKSIFFDSLGRRWMCQDIHGNPQNESYNRYTFSTMCPGSGWRKHIVDLARWLMLAYGATGIYFDEFSHGYGRVCYADDHDHGHPGAFNQSSLRLIGEAVSEMRKANKDSVSMSEGCSDIYGQFLSVHLALGGDCQPENRFPQMFKYTFPDYILIREVNNEDDLYRALLLGSGFWLHDGNLKDPKLRGKITAAIKLRRELKDYFAYGTYQDTDGVEVTDPSVECSSFSRKDGKAVVFFNPRRKRSARCDLKVPGRASRAWAMGLDLKRKSLKCRGAGGSFRIPSSKFSVVVVE